MADIPELTAASVPESLAGTAERQDEQGEFTEPLGIASQLLKFIRNPETLTLGFACLLCFGAFWLWPEFVDKGKGIRESVQGFLLSGLEPEPKSEIKTWMAVLIPAAGSLAFISLLYSLATRAAMRKTRKMLVATGAGLHTLKGAFSQLEKERDELRRLLKQEREQIQGTLNQRNSVLLRTLNGTVHAASRIRAQLFPGGGAGTNKTIESLHYTYYIDKDFNAEVHKRSRIRAENSDLHFWEISFGVYEKATPAETFVDIGYRIVNHDSGSEIAYLPTLNGLHKKAVCIYFLPLLRPGTTREIEIVYKWPRMMVSLTEQGWEDLRFKLNTVGVLQDCLVEVYLEAGSGGSITASETGVQLPGMRLEAAKSYQGWPGWRYSASNVAPELLQNRIGLTLKWEKA